MRDWTFWHVAGIALLYVAVTVGLTLLRMWLHARHRRPQAGPWRFFWLIPYNRARNWVGVVVGPPAMLLVLWLAARGWAAFGSGGAPVH